MRRLHRSKHAGASAAAAVVALASGPLACSPDAPVTTRTVTLHSPKACPASPRAFAQYFALGDFEASAPVSGHLADQVGASLSEIAPDARALVVEATESSSTWSGVAPVAPSGDVDVLLLPALASCAFSGTPPARSAAALTPIAGDLALVVGGPVAGEAYARTWVADLATGVFAPLAGPDLGASRTGMTVTAFGSGALVAGGVAGTPAATLPTAVTFSASAGFDQRHPIQLSEPRAGHGAVVLAAGQTLLVGGVGADGKTVLATMDRVDPATGTAQEQGVAVLTAPRKDPTVLRLASGEILVAGGFDAAGNAVATIEWFSADASHATRTAQPLVTTGTARAFVALGAGGALAVVAPPARAASTFANVWVIGADGELDAATPLPEVTAPVLFAAAGGAPVLWTGAPDPGSGAPGGRWLRWQPWAGAFGTLGVLDAVPAGVGPSNAPADPGLALWLDATSSALTALRFDTRGPYAALDGPLLSATAADVAPDRLPATGVAGFDPSTGLTLGPGASAFVTDRTYADVSVSVQAPTGQPAMVVLRDELGAELEVGGPACPEPLPRAGAASTLTVKRAGASVTWAIANGANGACAAGVRAAARVSIGLRGPATAAASVVRDLNVTRLGP